MSKSLEGSSPFFLISCIFLLPLARTTCSGMTTTTYPTTTTTYPTTKTTYRATTTSRTTKGTTTAETTAFKTTTTTAATTAMSVDVLFSLSPSRGPVAGGTKVICSGQQLKGAISAIYFGAAGQGNIANLTNDSLTVYSPKASQKGSVAIIISTYNGDFIKTQLTFDYRPNPVIDRFDFAPVQLTSGGSILTLVGSSLDSVVCPQLNVTVVLKQPVEQDRVNSYVGNCSYNEISKNMTCLLPDLHLSENFTRKLQNDKQNQRNFSTTQSGSVANLDGPDESEANVYLGFVFDGYLKYQNVSESGSGLQLKLSFTPPPIIRSSTDVLTFDPKKDKDIQIEGELLQNVCNYGVRCEVLVGDGRCPITRIADNAITCVPPEEKPIQSPNDSFCRPHHQNSLNIEIRIGFRSYNYMCFDYYSPNVGLIAGLTVGLGIPALSVISVALYFGMLKLRCCKRTPPRQLPQLSEVDPPDISFKRQSRTSRLTTLRQNCNRNTIFQNLRMSIFRKPDSNVYSSENQIGNVEDLRNKDGGEPEPDDVARCQLNCNRGNFYPSNCPRSTDNDEYVNFKGGNGVSYVVPPFSPHGTDDGGAAGEPSDSPGVLRSSARQSFYPPSFGNRWDNNDINSSRNGDESENKETYANFSELG